MNDWIIVFSASRLHVVVIVLAVVFVAYASKHTRKRVLLLSLFSLAASLILSRIVSQFYYSPRPFVTDEIIPLIQHVADNGFPSDHMLLVSTITVVVLMYTRSLGSILIVLSVLVGLGRVFSGVHHPVDILGSVIIAVIAVLVSYLFIHKYIFEKL